MSYGAYAQKNSARVHYNEILDLTPFSTSGALSTHPVSPISGQPMASSSTSQPTLAERVLYRLAAVVVHYGTHQYGHYVAFRRLPSSSPPRLAKSLAETNGRAVFTDELDAEGQSRKDVGPGTGRGWLRISDDSVSRCGVESALAEGTGAFMLYYERVLPPLSASTPESAATPVAEMTLSGPSRLVSRASTPARIVRSVSLSGYTHQPAVSDSSSSSRSSGSGSDHGSSSPGSSITSVEETEETEVDAQNSAGKSVEDPEREDTPVPPVDPPEARPTS